MAVNANISFPAIWYFNHKDTNKPFCGTVNTLGQLLGKDIGRWPKLRMWVPGGICDRTGQHFLFNAVTNLPSIPWWLKPFDPIVGSAWYLKNWEADIDLDGPYQMTLDEYKSKVCGLVNTTIVQGISRIKRKALIRSADSFEEIIYIVNPEVFAGSDFQWAPPPNSEIVKYERSYNHDRRS
jgi:hypothetical protein